MRAAAVPLLLAALLVPAGPADAQVQEGARGRSVVDTPHNLSTSGPGVVRASSEEQVCIFCHTPHNAAPIQPLWNRATPVSAYSVYSSNSLDAFPGQPTGASKLCLSCHDGTIALGSVVSQDTIIQMAGGITTIPVGSANLGTDLSDDHPISFRYDSTLAFRDTRLLDPSALPSAVRLDAQLELQCTTCHDAHDNIHGDFLVMSNESSALCRVCHQISTTTIPAHVDCTSCHKTHSAPSGPHLLVAEDVTQTCVSCHDGSQPGAANILSELDKYSVHDTSQFAGFSSPADVQTDCADCHDPHTMAEGTGSAPDIQPTLGEIQGTSSSGGLVTTASHEYEVCFNCHADANVFDQSWVGRQITQINTRLEFSLSAVSFHPVIGAGRNPDVPSLRPPWTTGSIMYCSHCHGSERGPDLIDTGTPRGVHGSNEPPLLVARYETQDFTPESSSAYALCYRCHYRDSFNGILQNRSFPHSQHVVDAQTPCSVCHDAHGISSAQGSTFNNSHLINFDVSVVFPDPVTGRREFEDMGIFSGRCFLSCHGVPHSPLEYAQ